MELPKAIMAGLAAVGIVGGAAVVTMPADSGCQYTTAPGWADTSESDGHTVSLSCTQGGWIVWLNSDGTESHAWNGVGPFVYPDENGKLNIPNWQ